MATEIQDRRERKTNLFGRILCRQPERSSQRRDEAKEQLAQGFDPSDQKKAAKAAAIAEKRERENTFEAVAREWFTSYSSTLSEKHAKKLQRYLENAIFPVFGGKGVSLVEPSDILEVARPKEAKGRIETAHKICQLCGQVLEFAKITGRVKYNVGAGLSRALQPIRSQSYAAITEPKAIGTLLRNIDAHEGYFSIKYFLKIIPYVFTRPSELRLAEWKEFDMETLMWRIPAKRMNMRREHTVPLAPQVVALLRELRELSGNSIYLFPSTRAKTDTISDVGPLAALRTIGYTKEQMCLHGFRAMASTRLTRQVCEGIIKELLQGKELFETNKESWKQRLIFDNGKTNWKSFMGAVETRLGLKPHHDTAREEWGKVPDDFKHNGRMREQ